MIIESSQINMKSQHQALTKTTEQESLKMWMGKQRPDFENRGVRAHGMPAAKVDELTLSSMAQGAQPVPVQANLDETTDLDPLNDMKLRLIRMMIKALTGKDIKLMDTKALKQAMSASGSQDSAVQALAAQGEQNPSATPQVPAGYGIEYDYYASHYEYETTSFQAEGVIQTQDGQSIDFSASLNMSREFMQEQSMNFRAGDAVKIDPLVLNFNGNAAELSETKFSFDLDADGRSEQIGLLKDGSAFLALDKNGDGIINNGSELFGPGTGQGFSELATFDEDGNNFIDSGDSIYDRLRLWNVDNKGNQQLLGLGAKGIGAIYLGNIATSFQLKGSDNASLGQIAATSIFLTEDGQAGTVQQVDYTV